MRISIEREVDGRIYLNNRKKVGVLESEFLRDVRLGRSFSGWVELSLGGVFIFGIVFIFRGYSVNLRI